MQLYKYSIFILKKGKQMYLNKRIEEILKMLIDKDYLSIVGQGNVNFYTK